MNLSYIFSKNYQRNELGSPESTCYEGLERERQRQEIHDRSVIFTCVFDM